MCLHILLSTLIVLGRQEEGAMLTSEVIAFFKGKSKVATALKVSPAAVSQWGAEPPLARQYQIQILTEGKLVASDGSAVAKAA